MSLNEMFDHERWNAMDTAAAIAMDNRVCAEANLPRGHEITPAIVSVFFTQARGKVTASGRKLVVHLYNGLPSLVFKHKKMPENWGSLGMFGALPVGGRVDFLLA